MWRCQVKADLPQRRNSAVRCSAAARALHCPAHRLPARLRELVVGTRFVAPCARVRCVKTPRKGDFVFSAIFPNIGVLIAESEVCKIVTERERESACLWERVTGGAFVAKLGTGVLKRLRLGGHCAQRGWESAFAFVALGLMHIVVGPSPARAACLTPPGDVTADSKTDIVDVQCLL